MTFLAVNITEWSDRWMLAGISIATVFVILILLVGVLQLFGWFAKQSLPKVKAVPKANAATSAEEDDLAAVATALYLYQNEAHDEESGVLTIQSPHTYHSDWHGELNQRL